MTDRRHRCRTLAPGYQFGEATWRPPSANAAEQLVRQAHTHDFAHFNPAWLEWFCACGAHRDQHGDIVEPALPQTPDAAGWNVIEGDP